MFDACFNLCALLHVLLSVLITSSINVVASILTECHLVFPATVINGNAVSKTFQILYRNEDVTLNDIVLFKVHALVDAVKVIPCSS